MDISTLPDLDSLWALYNIWIILAVVLVLGAVLGLWKWRAAPRPRPSSPRPPQIPDEFEDQKELNTKVGLRSQDQALKTALKPRPEEVIAREGREGREKRKARKEQKENKERPLLLSDALSKTRENFWGRMKGLFSGSQLTSDELEGLEEILYTSDLGPKTVHRLMQAVEPEARGSRVLNAENLRDLLKSEMIRIFEAADANAAATSAHVSGAAPAAAPEPATAASPEGELNHVLSLAEMHTFKFAPEAPTVWMIVGVNGAGKTTTIGKLGGWLAESQKRVLLAAGDTFRAAASDQLKIWTDRAQVEIFSPPQVTDPSAVAYDAVQKGKAGNYDVVIVDTAGRLHTQKNLMEELRKMKRVVSKVVPDAPHEVLLVLDANSGQNALIQAKEFHEALGVTGVVLTKMDGTAKGGVAVGVACELGIPIKLIGVGEKIQDLRPFSAKEFVNSIL